MLVHETWPTILCRGNQPLCLPVPLLHCSITAAMARKVHRPPPPAKPVSAPFVAGAESGDEAISSDDEA